MTKIGTYAATAGLCAALAMAGCSTVRNARDRIVKPQARCADLTVQIYFEPDSAEVTSEGRAVLRAAAAQAKPCGVQSVSVLGLADASGAPQASLELSKRRADAVVQALAATGLPAAEFDTAAAGQAGSVTAGGDTRPLRRRADVTLKVRKP
jgi:peptidoglycan-associated lipoprotein